MYPHERSLVKRLENQPFALLGINSDEDLDSLRNVMTAEQMTWPSWWDGGSSSGPIATRYHVHGWPTTLVLDQRGVIRYIKLRGNDLDRAVDILLNELNQENDARSRSAAGESTATDPKETAAEIKP